MDQRILVNRWNRLRRPGAHVLVDCKGELIPCRTKELAYLDKFTGYACVHVTDLAGGVRLTDVRQIEEL